jgi:hypothetical protein
MSGADAPPDSSATEVPALVRAWATFKAAMAVFEAYDSSEATVADAIEALRVSMRESEPHERLAAAVAGFEHWAGAFEEARRALAREEIKAWVRKWLCAPSQHVASPYEVAQGAMKAAVHLSWKRLYALEVGRGHPEPAEAIRDAMTPPQQRAIEYYRRLYEELAAEHGETVEQMMRRVCGE